ncbi:MAG: recombination protein NinB [Candidatus Moranbacteria bacterium]|nr:recombination protein NinB [Candidatus Moranbacteria bacterium]
MKSRGYLILDSEAQKAKARQWLESLPLEPAQMLSIKRYVKNRSLSQNRLLHLWINCIKDFWYESTGQSFTAEAWKEQVKQQFLGIDCFSLPDGSIANRTRRTRDLSTAEFAEFLNQIEMYSATELGLILPNPEDLYYEALMKTTKENQ